MCMSSHEITESQEILPTVESTVALIDSDQFREGFVAVQTQQEQDQVDQIASDAQTKASKAARAEIEQYVAARLGVSVEEGKQRGKEWGDAIKEAGAEVSETTEGKTLLEYLVASQMSAIESDESYVASRQQAEEALQVARTTAEQQAVTLTEELRGAVNDPEFIAATEVWANAPDMSGETGEDGQGYNSGLIHFFQYRASAEKSGRFKVMEEPLSVEGFKAFSKRINEDLQAVGSGNSENQEAILQDSSGNKRIYILKPNGEMIVAFQAAGSETPRVTSVLVRQDEKSLTKNITASLQGNDKGKLNKLGEDVHRLL